MHIPNAMLHGSICPITATVAALGLGAAAVLASKAKENPGAARFGAVTALIFAAQMMNFPIQNGTSGHLLGGVLASALLGTPLGILSIAVVLTIQCLVFSDGGLAVLGANIINKSLIGAGVGGWLFHKLNGGEKGGTHFIALVFASWFSVLLSSLACTVELSISGTIPLTKVVVAMLSTHAIIGLGEVLITVGAVRVFSMETSVSNHKTWLPLVAAVVIVLLLTPFASSYPDGLEWIASKYHFLHESSPAFVAPLAEYAVPSMANETLSTALAGIAGVVLTFTVAFAMSQLWLKQRKSFQ